jgi:hypothetical protein
MNKKNKILLTVLLLAFFLSFTGKTHASFLDDAVDKVKDFFTPDPKKELTIESDITLAPGGDVDKNGQIDAGDIVRFTYSIKNTTDQKYLEGTLKTNINRETINFIHNVQGTPSLEDNQKTITIPNLLIRSLGETKVSFDARINLYDDKDRDVSTQPEYLDKGGKSILKSNLKKIVGKKITSEKLKSIISGNTRGNN